jgi:predicted MFS family arabinose efflux permease
MEIVLSILGIAGVLLFVGAVSVGRRGDKRKALLMVIAGCVLIANVVIWIIPTKEQGSLLEAQQSGEPIK